MYHSVIFTKNGVVKNTWDDWKLIPTSRPIFPPPPLKSKYIDLPGEDGQVDLTEALGGRPTFGNVTGTFSFILQPDYWSWDAAYSALLTFLHGQKVRISLEDNPGFYREGRCTINTFQSDKFYSVVAIDYVVNPFDKPVT